LGDEGLVANWLMYYLKGGDHLHDFSPYDNHGTINGAVWKDGRYGWALKFDGVDDYVDVSGLPSLSNQPRTLTFWAITDDWTQNGTFLNSKEIPLTAGTYTDGILFGTTNNANPDPTRKGFSNFPTSGEWHYFVVTIDSGGNILNAYLDAVSQTLDVDNSWLPDPGSVIGAADIDSPDTFFNGTIAIMRLYKVEKSSSWVSRRFNRTRGIFGI